MSLILDNIQIIRAGRVIDKINEIMEIWRVHGNSIGSKHKIEKDLALKSVQVNGEYVEVVFLEKS